MRWGVSCYSANGGWLPANGGSAAENRATAVTIRACCRGRKRARWVLRSQSHSKAEGGDEHAGEKQD